GGGDSGRPRRRRRPRPDRARGRVCARARRHPRQQRGSGGLRGDGRAAAPAAAAAVRAERARARRVRAPGAAPEGGARAGVEREGGGGDVTIGGAPSRPPRGPPFDPGIKLGSTGTLHGSTKAALERITTGLAAEVHDDGVAVNSLAPVAAVRTPGAEVHLGPLLDERPEIVEPVELIADAAFALATCDPATVTGRGVYSRPPPAALSPLAV